MSELFPGISDTGLVIARYFYLLVFLVMFVAFTYIIMVGAAGGVRGKGPRWPEFLFYNIWIITLLIWLAAGPPLMWRAFNIGLRDSIPEAAETYHTVNDIIDMANAGVTPTPIITATATIVLPTLEAVPTVEPTPVQITSTPLPTYAPVLQPAITATSWLDAPTPTLDWSLWNAATRPPNPDEVK